MSGKRTSRRSTLRFRRARLLFPSSQDTDLMPSLTKEELRSILERCNIKPTELWRIIGVHERTVFRWLDGSSPIEGPTAILFRTWERYPATARWAAAEARASHLAS